VLLDGAVDLSRCMGLCAQCTCLSTTPLKTTSTNDWKGKMAT